MTGATIVQLRDKSSETAELINTARRLHGVTSRHGVPLIINDRADVAIAVGAEGLHIGQDDMDIASARKIMGDKAIIGVTAQTKEEAIAAAKAGADYLGIGTVYSTATKDDTKLIIGPPGVRDILAALAEEKLDISTICIGSINAANVQRVLYQTSTPNKHLDGVAVVSAIMGSKKPKAAAASLRDLIRAPPPFARLDPSSMPAQVSTLLANVTTILRRVSDTKPLNHNMTNLVVQNFAANVALAIGSSPIMSADGAEAADLAALKGSLVINMGSVAPESASSYIAGVSAYNTRGNPVIFDPVGGGATALRRDLVRRLMSEGYFDVIKGNESEIQTVLGTTGVIQHGVDAASDSVLKREDRVRIVKTLAAREKDVVLMTGRTDYLSDGVRTYAISNGHEYLGSMTGSGCTLGTTIAACVAVEKKDKLNAVLAGVLLYEIAAERAAKLPSVRGPGTFVPALIDELYLLRTNLLDESWLRDAKVEAMHI